jgi:hypothetical protein
MSLDLQESAMTPQDFYRSHSPMSDPGSYAHLYGALPDDMTSLCKIVQTTYLHYWGGKDAGIVIPPERAVEVDNRRVETILEKMMAAHNAPLTEPRPAEKRVIGCCRDAALLLCSFLRHKGIPARIRSGFAPYINIGHPTFAVDHVVTEYWDEGRWKLADAEQSKSLVQRNGITFDVLDIPRDRFLVAGQVWQAVRSGAAEEKNYGGDPHEKFWTGLWSIRTRLVNDINSLSKVEYLLWDTWGLMVYKKTLSKSDLATLDRAAALTMQAHDDTQFEVIRALNDEPAFAKPDRFMCHSPVTKPQQVIA